MSALPQLGRTGGAGPAEPGSLAPEAPPAVRVHPRDDVAVAVRPLAAGTVVEVEGGRVALADDVRAGHKLALRALELGEPVHKYGFPIGAATAPIAAGAWVHAHNLATRLSGALEYRWGGAPAPAPASAGAVPTFDGYRRGSGNVGTRNEVWIINTVGCVNTAAERIARAAAERFAGAPGVDGVHAFAHPYGCSQLGDDLANTQRVLAGLMRNPNAGGVLVLGLGCENNQLHQLLALAEGPSLSRAERGIDRSRLRSFNTQDVVDEVDAGVDEVGALVAAMAGDRRAACPASDLVLGHKCGGSDGFSGITANPLLGRLADRVSAFGGRVLLTEVPEMFGAEQVLMDRCVDRGTFDALVAMVNDFKAYFLRHGQPVYENPSPGNKAGGLTTLEEKSLGAVQKGGRAPVRDVLRYGEAVRGAFGGLSLLEAPGNDGVSCTAMAASGATLLLFTTGRGTPLGFPVPTLKVSSNSGIAARKPHWVDFDAGRLLGGGGATLDVMADDLLALVLEVASGRARANNERNGDREIAIWKGGVTL